MKFTIKTILIAVFALICGLFFPWWAVCIPAFIIPIFFISPHKRRFSQRKKEIGGLSFLSGFLAGSLVWGIAALWINSGNESILSTKIAELITQTAQPTYAILITTIIGGLLCAFPAMTGAYLGLILKRHQ